MLQTLLELFTTQEKAKTMLANPIIEIIFTALFGLFVITIVLHLVLFFKIRKTRNYIKETKRMDIEPLSTIKTEFEARQTEEAIKLDTFIQEKISSWRLFQLPVVNLIKLVQMTISVFILLGVLGTFIGLTISLGSINAGADQLVENVAGVLSGIDVAFYTSIVGMSFSLVMTVLVRALNTEFLLTDLMLIAESHLESHEQHGMNRMIEVSENIHGAIQSLEETNNKSLGSIVEAFAGFKDYTEGLQQSAEDLASFNNGLRDNLEEFQELFYQMKDVTDGFRNGTEELNENFASLFSYFTSIDRKHERMADAFERTNETIQRVSEAQIDSLHTFDGSVTELKAFTSSLLDGQEAAREALDNINRKTENFVATISAQTTTLKEIFGDDLTVKLNSISHYINDLKKGFDRVGDSIGSLPDALAVINQTQKEHAHLLGDRFRELKQFNESFGKHLKTHENHTLVFEKQLRDAAATFEMLATKNNHLIHEMNRSMTESKNIFANRDQQLITNVGTLQDTLTSHVTNVESTLGQKLDALVRNLDQTLYSVTDGMNRELAEIRRVSEEMSQHHARLMQQFLQEIGREIQTLNQQSSGRTRIANTNDRIES